MSVRILVAGDDPEVRSQLARSCQALGHEALEASDDREAVELARGARPDLILLDVDMPPRRCLELLPELFELERRPQIVMVTSATDVPTAVAAMRAGRADFLEKPVRESTLSGVIERACDGRAAAREPDDERLKEELARLRSGAIVGRSRALRTVLDQIQRVATTPRTTVLVTGESGVGKELVARAIHESSRRAGGPFVAINCAALAENLLEAELFGYEPGAFTGASPKGREGLFAAAEGGTLFLDEIGELAPGLQARLLRVLQERAYRRVGGCEDRDTDVRVIASTNRDLAAMVEARQFREDLFYRLNILSIVVPPLRARRDDVLVLAEHFLHRFAREFGRDLGGFDECARALLERHSWPGNVRELANAVERAALHAESGLITAADLGLDGAAGPAPVEGARVLPLDDFSLRGMEAALIRRALQEAGGNRSATARMLGVNRTTLYNKLRTYGIP